MRQTFAEGTWLDPEEMSYPEGSLRQSRRRAKALCPDGIVRTAVVGIPDTFFSIPARLKARGKTVAGYVSVSTASGSDVATDEDPAILYFHPYKYRKNGDAFETKGEQT